MAKYCGAVCRLCRREGEKLFLKGERCFTSKCAVEKREGGPGQHGRRRQGHSDFKIQLREKQKTKRMFGMVEKQFENYVQQATKKRGVTGTELLQRLELRLDNIVYRLGFGQSRAQSRQLVNHGLVLVNGQRTTVPSYRVDIGDVIEVREKSKKNVTVIAAMESASARFIPEWLVLDKAGVKGSVKALPTRDQLPQNVREQLIVELYSR
ncbi:MAG: 30S ribosomal protein S4 [Oligoflexia bacterium]|nr:30S ribosomal protein S4 [Oligoflexia bacterium]